MEKNLMKILVTAAHPDDIEFDVAGSVARWVKEGAAVTYCIITDGSAGSNDPHITQEALIATRRQEQIAAAQIVGAQDVRFLGYTDGTLQPMLDLRRALTKLIRELKPDRVVCQDPTFMFSEDGRYINHPDHRAAGEATLYAVFPSAETRPIFPELLSIGYEPHHVPEVYLYLSPHPNQRIDITETIDLKMRALASHKSQAIGEETLQMVKCWCKNAGDNASVDFAEEFRVITLG